jgi:hypothetical protein
MVLIPGHIRSHYPIWPRNPRCNLVQIGVYRGRGACGWNFINLSGGWSTFECAGRSVSGGCWRR